LREHGYCVNMNEEEIIRTAIQHLEEIAGVPCEMGPARHKALDGMLTLIPNTQKVVLHAEVKKEIRNLHLPHIQELAQKYKPFVLITWRLFPNIRETLREMEINYIEANGNVFVKLPGLYLFIDNQKALKDGIKDTNRAFTKTGLKVVFQFLLDKELINRTQRKIAKIAGVALGNVPQVIKGLLDTGYIVRYDKKRYQWRDREALLQKWINEYETTLKPALLQGRYRLPEGRKWQGLTLRVAFTCWGGEPAGDLLTHYLRPEILTMYTVETRLELMKHYKLLPDNDGDVFVYEKFWPERPNENTAPPLLVYADLINNNDKRSIETAQKIYEKHIQPEL